MCVLTVHQGIKVDHHLLQTVHSHSQQHWVTVTSIGCAQGSLRVYDSMYRNLDEISLSQIASFVTVDPIRGLIIDFAEFQKQRNKMDCGLYAVAAAFSLTLGKDASQDHYDDMKLRSHLHSCLERSALEEYPKYSGTVLKRQDKRIMAYVCCVCKRVVCRNITKCTLCLKSCHVPDPNRTSPCSVSSDRGTRCTSCCR